MVFLCFSGVKILHAALLNSLIQFACSQQLVCIFVSSKSIQQQHVADLFHQDQIQEQCHIYQHAKTFMRVFVIEMFFIRVLK